MLQYSIKRVLAMIPTFLIISMVAFAIIQLPPGDYLSAYVARLTAEGQTVQQDEVDMLRERYGLDQPIYVQYTKWMGNILLRGDFGASMLYRNVLVKNLIWERLGLTAVLTLATTLFTWIVAFPIGIYSAVRQYSLGDYLASFVGFVGVSVPNFLFALVLLVLAYMLLGQNLGGLFSLEYANAPWTWAKVVDLVKHLGIPTVVLGLSGTAGLIRTMRANLLDELQKPYVATARAKGQSETVLLLRYPVRAALNPFVSTIGYLLPSLISGSIIVSIVMSLPTSGPMLQAALMAQDMYLAGAFILLLSALTLVGTLISDILLAWLDPRVRLSLRGG